MKSYLFYGLILAFIIAAFFVFKKKTSGEGFDFNFFETTEIAPQEQWRDILVGKWKVDIKFKNYQQIWIFTGEEEYRQDGTFTKYLTQKSYSSPYSDVAVKIDNANLDIVAGGSLEGTWVVNADMTWAEKYKKCAFPNSFIGERGNKEYQACDYFSKEATYGEKKGDSFVNTVKCFTKNKILIEGKRYSDEGINIWELKRIK